MSSKGQLVLCVYVDEMNLGIVLSAVQKRRSSLTQPILYVFARSNFERLYERGKGLVDHEIRDYEHLASKHLRELMLIMGIQLMVDEIAQRIKFSL